MGELPTYSSVKVTMIVFILLFSLVFRERCHPFLVLQPELKASVTLHFHIYIT